ncbi:hypothetical protein Tco_1455130 [Tanacetum coccineum]
MEVENRSQFRHKCFKDKDLEDSAESRQSRTKHDSSYFVKEYQVKDQDPRSQACKWIFKRNSQEYKAPRLKTSQEGSSIE